MPDITLTIPAQPEHLHLLRVAAAAGAARQGFSLDDIDDLRIAVTEGAAYLVDLRPGAGKIVLRVFSSPDALMAVLCTDAHPAQWPPPNAEKTLAWKVLAGLADESAFFLYEEVFPAFRLVKRLRRE
jgi:serine/threonine-protein kinase RsbW